MGIKIVHMQLVIRHSHIVESDDYGKIFQGSRISEFYQLIICVRNTKRILRFEIMTQEK